MIACDRKFCVDYLRISIINTCRLYRERITEIKSKLEEVHEGVAKEYRQPLEDLQENMRIRIEVAGILKKLRLESIENNCKAEDQAAKQNFEVS